MNKKIITVLTILAVLSFGSCAYMNAQVTVGANSAPNATLDVKLDNSPSNSTLAGVIAPNVSRQYLNDKNGDYGSAQTGAIVFVNEVNGSATLKAINVKVVGYYYFDGTLWQPFNNSRRIVSREITDASYTITLADEGQMFITNRTGGVTINFPILTPAEAGFTVMVWNNNPTGNNLYQNADLSPMITAPAIAKSGGGVMLWTGSYWIPISKS